MQKPHCSVQYEVRYGTRSGSSSREHVIAQLVEVDTRVDRRAVAEDVQRRVGGVDDPLAVRPLDPSVADVHSRGGAQSKIGVPVGVSTSSSGTSRASTRERLADAVTRQAARDREELAHELEEFLPEALGRRDGIPVDRHRVVGGRGPAPHPSARLVGRPGPRSIPSLQ